MIRPTLLALLLVSSLVPCLAESPTWETYPLDRSLRETLHELAKEEAAATPTNATETTDATAPPDVPNAVGRTLADFAEIDSPFRAYVVGPTLLACATKKGHAKLADLLGQLQPPEDLQVSITYALHELPLQTVTDHPEFKATAHLAQSTIRTLINDGKTTLLGKSTVVATPNVNAQSESVDEVIHATEFEIEQSSFPSDPKLAVLALSQPDVPTIPIPGAFGTRDIGTWLNCTTTVRHDQQRIQLTLFAEHAELLGWTDFSGQTKPTLQPETAQALSAVPGVTGVPRFRSLFVTTSTSVVPGKSTLVYGSRHPERESMIYGFVTASILP